MAITIDDLKPKSFTIKLSNQEVICKPLKLHHALIMQRIGAVLQDPNTNKEKLLTAEQDFNEVVSELIPELADVELDLNLTLQLLEGMMSSLETAEMKELNDKGVDLKSDPKA